MQISTKDWKNYIAKLSKLNATAAEKMQQYIAKHGFADTEAIIDYAYGLVTKYGEGSAALSAQMFETIAEMEGAIIQPAVMAPTASRNEVAKMVNGIMKQTQNENVIANAVGRKVKQAGADTTLQNALRYGAEFAWIPAGDTCAFCIALASRGWQLASKKAIKNGHAEHIHSNCDCTYAIRFDSKTHIEGYDPKYYDRMYYDAQDRAAEEGTFWSGKSDKDAINQMRRDKYKLNAEKIREQHRAAYAKRKGSDNLITNFVSADVTNLDDEYVLKSVGAKAQNYDIMDLDTGEMYHLVEGSYLQDKEVFAGKGSSKAYRDAYKFANRYGGDVKDWQHVKAKALLATEDGDRRAEVHWSQCAGIGKKEFFVKKWEE